MASQQQQQQVVAKSTRWCPTPEQLMLLDEMYREGLRTPKSSQIEQITAYLACYGPIEGKNVMYWFQNHKARDRQNLRRRRSMRHHLPSRAQYYAVAAHHGHGHHHSGFLTSLQTVTPYGYQLLSPSTSPTLAAAATTVAAAAYGYYYPTTAVAAPPPSRCAGNIATPPSTTQLFHYQAGGGGGPVSAEADGRPEYSSLGKLNNLRVAIEDVVVSSAAVDMTPPGFEVAPQPAAFCRPLKTLDLFPGGFKEEQHDMA